METLETVALSSQELARMLFETAQPLSDSYYRSHVYTKQAIDKNLTNYRIASINQILKHTELQELPRHIRDFIAQRGEVLLMANIINGVVFYVLLRDMKEKTFLGYGHISGLFYGMGSLPQDFKYGTPICLVEGVLDCDSLRPIYPYTLALYTAMMSIFQLQTLSLLTDKVYLLYDNDETGEKNIPKERLNLIKAGIEHKVLSHPPLIKDTGKISEFDFYGHTDKRDTLISYYTKLFEQNKF